MGLGSPVHTWVRVSALYARPEVHGVKIRTVSLRQFCQFEDLTITFQDGLNAIVGPVGSGKSNLFRAMRGAFTNDFARDGLKLDNIRRQAPARNQSSVTVEFTNQAGQTGELTRGLRPSGHRLKLAGSMYTGEDEVNRQVLAFLGLDGKTALDYIFVPQWEVFSFLSDTRTQRLATFQRLFGASLVEGAYEAVNQRYNRLTVPDPVDLDRLHAMAADATRDLAAAQAEYQQKYAGLPLIPAEKGDPDRQLLVAWQHQQDAQRNANAVKTKLAQLNQALMQAMGTMFELRQDAEGRHAVLDQTRSNYDRAVAGLTHWKTYNALQQRHQLLTDALKNWIQEEAACQPPALPAGYRDEASRLTLVNERNERQQRATELKRYIVAATAGVCAHCGTAGVILTARLPEYQSELHQQEQHITSLAAVLDRWWTYDKAVCSYENKHAELLRRRNAIQTELEHLVMCGAPDTEAAELQGLVSDYQQLQTSTTKLDNECLAQQRATCQIEAQVIEAEQAKAQFDKTLEALSNWNFAPDNLAAAEVRLAERHELYMRKARLEGQLTGLQRDVERTAHDVLEAEQTMQRAQRLRSWGERLADWRQILHRDQLPSLLIRYRLGQLLPSINSYLEILETPFRVSLDDETGFLADFHSGPQAGETFTAIRLSGGQKVLMALAFRMALNTTGLLCLDEATAGLDTHYLTTLQRALAQLRQHSHAMGLQVILITHERSLDRCFDHIIELSTD